MDNETRYRDQLRYAEHILEKILKSQRDLEKRKALEFVIDKLNAGYIRSVQRSRAMQAEV
jgi:hypothetical protein